MTNITSPLLAMLTLTTLLSGCFSGGAPALSPTVRRIQEMNERALHSVEKQRFDDARTVLDEALRLATSLDDGQQQTLTLINLARLERRLGRLQQAEPLLERARRAAATGYAADLAQETALLMIARNHLPEAERWAEIALQEERGDLTGRRLNLLARIALLNGDEPKALRLAEQALGVCSAPAMAEERANALRIIGQLKVREKRFDEAERLLNEALTLDRRQERPLKIAADLEALAQLMDLKGQAEQGREYRQRARMARESSAAPRGGL